jgi:LysM repeat protein
MSTEPLPSTEPEEPSVLARLWADLAALGWRETILRYASHALMLTVVAVAIWVSGLDLGVGRMMATVNLAILAPPPTPAPVAEAQSEASTPPVVASLPIVVDADPGRISRLADVHTLIPTRGRSEVIPYTVQKGDTLFGIADKFSLKPETVLWGNYFTLKDDPHLLLPGQVLNILPVDGTYHYVTQGNTLEQIAKFYGVTPQDIIDWPGNRLDPNTPVLVANTWLVIPGGHRESQAWVVPTIKRSDTASGNRANNFGQCPGGYTGAIGVGSFVWPTDNHTVGGYNYSAIHHGVDLRAGLGDPIYAVDGGVVVYAGWNDFGYGNLVVIDHGNGWQSVYGHLSQWNVVCGQSVFQGNVIGLAGSTGRSSGPHLHFELRYNGAYVNPLDVLP